ncbi:hypothetical protein [Shewanella gelidii]|uniref:Uncharacterized protein n=1 Tax=Shewanella gelidii TaxID=1642821 RepID=A0A917N8E0_9GAMM|nr:hypothetical protein [Shewanella gelidii]MCL1096782.1 hypothetical protein [Shewanella gelidii]GGI70121.1 hypothetical protein GCM10009332_04190 [Shewanella gelidii]
MAAKGEPLEISGSVDTPFFIKHQQSSLLLSSSLYDCIQVLALIEQDNKETNLGTNSGQQSPAASPYKKDSIT